MVGEKETITKEVFDLLKDPKTNRLKLSKVREALVNIAREDVLERYYSFNNIDIDRVNGVAEEIAKKYHEMNPDIDQIEVAKKIVDDFCNNEFGLS
ncbi:hypothetical protein M0R36_10930 [bacterium]|jgi:hypothetical protein|nr:hypothetical protein [bacterium]